MEFGTTSKAAAGKCSCIFRTIASGPPTVLMDQSHTHTQQPELGRNDKTPGAPQQLSLSTHATPLDMVSVCALLCAVVHSIHTRDSSLD